MTPTPFGRLGADIARALRTLKYELTGEGVYLPAAKTMLGGVFRHAHAPAGAEFGPWQVDPNRVVDQGLVYLLNAAFAGAAQQTNFYLAPFSGNVTPAAGWKAETFPATATEFTAYAAAERLPWKVDQATTPSLGNSAHLTDAQLVIGSGGPYSVTGLALVTAPAKSSTPGTLVAATRFSAPRTNLASGDKLALEYVITASDSST